MKMDHVAEHDQKSMATLLAEALATRSDEALSLVLETAYCVGRRTGYAECADLTRKHFGAAPLASDDTGKGGTP